MKMNTKQLAIFCLLLLIACSSTHAKRTVKRYGDGDMLAEHQKHAPTGDDRFKFLNIHLIPHSHDDVGWLKTVDQYYYGANNTNQWAGVQYTIDSVVDELSKNSTRKYIQVETAFLYRWWIDSPESRHELMRKLVANGQLEFINGGWCMHDEATPYYEDIVDQMTVGHLWLLETFGVVPTIGWHIDPFGHQATNAALFNQMGFNGWWFSRIDYQDKDKRLNTSSLEMVWSPYQASGIENSIFTAVNYNHYNPPPGFNFDLISRDEPIMDNKLLEDYNVDVRSDEFVSYFRNMSTHFRTSHLMHTMGEDFNYASALMWYKNMDKLIDYINARSDIYQVKVFYSTPSIYLAELQKLNITLPTKTDDFFPYADVEYGYWTGYFTSRVAIKGNVRDTGRYLQHIRNIFSVAKITNSSQYLSQNYQKFLSNLDSIEQNMAILQHHDAVAGTEKQQVAYDYVYRLQNSTDRINEVLHPILEEATFKEIGEKVSYYQYKWNATAREWVVTYESLLNGKTVLLRVHNPTVARNITVKVKVPQVQISIVDSQNNSVYGEVFCLNESDSDDCDLYFEYAFDAYSPRFFKLVPNANGVNTARQVKSRRLKFLQFSETFKVAEGVSLEISEEASKFLLKTCRTGSSNLTCTENPFEVRYNYYNSYQGNGQRSGAYIFRPATRNLNSSIPYSSIKDQKIYNGKLLTIVSIEGEHVDAQLRVYANQDLKDVVELQSFVKSIPIEDYYGKEIVLHVNTDLNNNKTFFTDSNGLELQKRILNYRPTWNLSVNEPSSGNYYPVNGLITLFDTDSLKRVSLVNDRSQGGTSLKEGQLELMIHRRLLKDDGRGVGEPLNETETYNSQVGLQQILRHFIVFEEIKQTERARFIQNYVDTLPIIFQAVSNSSVFNTPTFHGPMNPASSLSVPKSPLLNNTDPFLKIYFRPFGEDYLLRLNNLHDQRTSLYILPDGFELVDELTLNANQSKQSWADKRYTWKTESEECASHSTNSQSEHPTLFERAEKFEVRYMFVLPLQLRAFRIRVVPSPQVDQVVIVD